MEELIGLLLVLLFGGIEAWNKAKKKKRGQGTAQEGNPKRGEKKKRDFLPEAWPTVELDARPVAGCNEEEPVQTIAEVAPGMPPGGGMRQVEQARQMGLREEQYSIRPDAAGVPRLIIKQ